MRQDARSARKEKRREELATDAAQMNTNQKRTSKRLLLFICTPSVADSLPLAFLAS
jgi:hypothetical protein